MGGRKRVTDIRKGTRLGPKDHLIKLIKSKCKPAWMTQADYENAPEHLMISELEVNGNILITILLSPKDFPRHELKALYKKRGHVELNLRNIKTTLGMETLTCKTPIMIEKEMWVAYNLI
ncbi:MAG: transposase [Thiohalomonadales bacterium]